MDLLAHAGVRGVHVEWLVLGVGLVAFALAIYRTAEHRWLPVVLAVLGVALAFGALTR